MPHAKKRKDTCFASSVTKSAFFYGKPNTGKRNVLEHMDQEFARQVRSNILLLNETESLLIPIIKNDKKNSAMRAFEKAHRPAGINSAFCQNAFDMAVTHLSQRYNDIRQEMYSAVQNIFTKSKVLFAMSLMNCSKSEMADAMESVRRTANNKDASFYRECAETLADMSDAEFSFSMTEFQDLYAMVSRQFSVPQPKHEDIPLDSRLMTIEPSRNIQDPFVISITDPFKKRKRFSVPLRTSARNLQRLKHYDKAGTVTLRLRKDGSVKIAWAFMNHLQKPATAVIKGVDTGITDCFFCSDEKKFGSMTETLEYYQCTVEPAFAKISDLRNKKSHIKHFLKKHKRLPEAVKKQLICKMDRLQHMIDCTHAAYRKKRRYYGMLDHKISAAVSEYIKSIDSNTITVIERLDIKEFRKSRRANGKMSTFARGKLQKRLMEELNWNGLDFAEVEPAYTSQVCPDCFNRDKNNRNGKDFKCTCCGFHGDADYVASINIRERYTDSELTGICNQYRYNHKKCTSELDRIYSKRNNLWKLSNNKTVVA